MARSSSHGSRRATTWAATQKPTPMPRVVRLGRPANDNSRHPGTLIRLALVALAAAATAAILIYFRPISSIF